VTATLGYSSTAASEKTLQQLLRNFNVDMAFQQYADLACQGQGNSRVINIVETISILEIVLGKNYVPVILTQETNVNSPAADTNINADIHHGSDPIALTDTSVCPFYKNQIA